MIAPDEILFVRDLDGTGSPHVCAKGAPARISTAGLTLPLMPKPGIFSRRRTTRYGVMSTAIPARS